MKPTMHSVLDRLYLLQGVDILPAGESFRLFAPDPSIQYHPLCDDFGPMNMSSIIQFVRQLEDELNQFQSCTLLYSVETCKRSLTNAVFLLGAYMILRMQYTAEEVAQSFAWLEPNMIEAYRDATFNASDFDLSLIDCWRGLIKGMEQGWLEMPSSPSDYRWGDIDVDEYDHYDNPLNGDMHEIVPGKLIAFKGPRDLCGGRYLDDAQGSRDFSAECYFDIFDDFGV